jgi:RimJ/RimL family protein N-acetyltransferase
MNLDAISPRMIGDKIMLGPLREDLNDVYRRWLHDMETSIYLLPGRLLTVQMESEWLRSAGATGHLIFTVYEKETGKPIGTTSLMGVDSVNRSAEFGIMIGEKEFQNRGYGTEATRLTIDYGFNIANLESIFLRVHEFNKRAIRIYDQVGFKICGKRRRAFYAGGRFFDDVLMDIVHDEFPTSPISQLVDKMTQSL